MRKSGIIVLVLLASIWSAVSCNKQLDTTFDQQEKAIETLVNDFVKADPSVKVYYRDGATRAILVHGAGDSLSAAGAVSFYYAGHYISGRSLSADNLFATNNKAYARSVKWEISDSSVFSIMTLNLSDGGWIEGLRKGLVGVQAGEECYVMFSGKHGFHRNKQVGPIPANSALAYHLWIQSVSNE